MVVTNIRYDSFEGQLTLIKAGVCEIVICLKILLIFFQAEAVQPKEKNQVTLSKTSVEPELEVEEFFRISSIDWFAWL